MGNSRLHKSILVNIIILLRWNISRFHPSYFALVMATGIVSIAAKLLGFGTTAYSLFQFNKIAYVVLWAVYLIRLTRYTSYFIQDLTNHFKSPGFLTIVAGTSVLGNQFALFTENYFAATVLYFTALALWIILIYMFFVVITIKRKKPTLNKGLNGTWLLIVVATQSISILGVQVQFYLDNFSKLITFISLILFLLGCFFYIIIITLIFYRLTFFIVKAEEFAPPYWISMGAVAITTLAGSLLILNANHFDFINALTPFIKGLSLLFWAFGTWWIPLIIILGIWRHLYKKIPFVYHPQYWGMVFPLGMYTVCTYRLSYALNIDFIRLIASSFIYFALAAWLLTFAGMVYNFLNGFYIALPKKTDK